MSEGANPRLVGPPATTSREQAMREFRQRQAQRRREISVRKRKLAAALKAGDMAAVRVIGPLYE